jgi:hypothetical protein
MTFREKTVLILMVIAISVGGYMLFFNAPEEPVVKKTRESAKKTDAFVLGVAKALSKDDTRAGTDLYIITKAAMEWTKEPFMVYHASRSKGSSTIDTPKPHKTWTFVYSGYLEASHRKLAIINGMEYEVGDTLLPSGYVVQRISPFRVIIQKQGAVRELVLKTEKVSYLHTK